MKVTVAFCIAVLACGWCYSMLPTLAEAQAGSASVLRTDLEADLLAPFENGGVLGDEMPLRAAVFESARMVRPNILGLATNPRAVRIPDPAGGGGLSLPVVAFDAREGFRVDDEGNVHPSNDPNVLSFSIQARRGGSNLDVRVHRGRVHATLNSDRSAFVAEFDAQAGAHVLQVANRDMLGIARCGVGVERTGADAAGRPKDLFQPSRATEKPTAAAIGASKNPTFRIGVLVAYTPQALVQAGTVASLEMTADLSIEQVNRALSDSGQAGYLRLERVGALVDSGIDELSPTQQPIPSSRFAYVRNLSRESAPIAAARVIGGADIVATLVADEGNTSTVPPDPFYGIAFTQRPNCQPIGFPTGCSPGPEYLTYAFAVVSRPFATLNFTFAHEIGHTLGAEHEPRFGVGEGLASFLHSYGHRVSQVAMDIMADPPCITPNPDDPPGTPLICTTKRLQYANPTIPFFGTQTPSGTTVPFTPAIDGNRTRDVSLTFRKLATGTSNLVGGLEPERLFWDGLE